MTASQVISHRALPPAPATQTFRGQDGIRLSLDEVGDHAAPPVILLHGGGQTRHAWHHTLHLLGEAGYHGLAYDTRGHGDSEWSAHGDYSPDALVADLRELIAQLPELPVLVGASMGGMTSLVAIGESHQPIAVGLVLVDTAARLETAGVERILDFMRAHTDGFDSLQEAAAAVADYNPQRRPAKDPNGLTKNLRLHVNGRWYWHWDPRFLEHATRNTDGEALVLQERREAAAARIRVPTLLIRGGQSDVVSIEGVRALQSLIPHAEWVDVAGAGHMVAGDRNDLFSAAVITFLKKHFPG